MNRKFLFAIISFFVVLVAAYFLFLPVKKKSEYVFYVVDLMTEKEGRFQMAGDHRQQNTNWKDQVEQVLDNRHGALTGHVTYNRHKGMFF